MIVIIIHPQVILCIETQEIKVYYLNLYIQSHEFIYVHYSRISSTYPEVTTVTGDNIEHYSTAT